MNVLCYFNFNNDRIDELIRNVNNEFMKFDIIICSSVCCNFKY